MAYIIIFAIIGFIAMYSIYWKDDISDRIAGAFIGVMGIFMGAIFGILMYMPLGGFLGSKLQTIEIVETQEIYALNDSSAIENSHFLFSGYVNEKLVYRYVILTDKGKHIKEINADNVYINEGDFTPYIEHHKQKFKKDWYNWFAHDLFLEDYSVIFVPSNTITTEYNIDLN